MNQELPQPKDGDLVLGGFEGTKRTLRSDSNEEEKMDTKEMVGFYGYREGEDITELWFVHQEKIYYFGTIKNFEETGNHFGSYDYVHDGEVKTCDILPFYAESLEFMPSDNIIDIAQQLPTDYEKYRGEVIEYYEQIKENDSKIFYLEAGLPPHKGEPRYWQHFKIINLVDIEAAKIYQQNYKASISCTYFWTNYDGEILVSFYKPNNSIAVRVTNAKKTRIY